MLLTIYLVGFAITAAYGLVMMPEIRLAASLNKDKEAQKLFEEQPGIAALACLILIVFWPATWYLMFVSKEK